MYLLRLARRYVSSTTSISWLLSALLVLLYVVNSSRASLCCLLISNIFCSVIPSTISRFYPRLTRGTNGVDDSVAYTAPLKVRKISPSCPLSLFE